MMNFLGNTHWFSSMNLTSGYWQIKMKEKNKPKTVFISREELFEFNLIPFEFYNVSATFQYAMDIVLGKYN